MFIRSIPSRVEKETYFCSGQADSTIQETLSAIEVYELLFRNQEILPLERTVQSREFGNLEINHISTLV